MKRALLLGVLALLACDPVPEAEPDIVIVASTAAPPARSAEIVNDDPTYSVTLSTGAVLAARCWDSCEYQCIAPELTVGDPNLLEIRSVYRYGSSSSELALIGKRAGSTTLTIRTKCAERSYAVSVLD